MEALGKAEPEVRSCHCLEVSITGEAVAEAKAVYTTYWARQTRVSLIKVGAFVANAIFIMLHQLD